MELRKIIDAILSKTKMMGNQDILKKFMSVEDISHLEDFFLLKNKLFEVDEDSDVKMKITNVYVPVFSKLIIDLNKDSFDDTLLKDNLTNLNEKEKGLYEGYIVELKKNKHLFIYLKNKKIFESILNLYRIENRLFLDENMSVKCKYDESNNNFEIEGILKIEWKSTNNKENFKHQIKQCCIRFNDLSKQISNCHIHLLRNNLIIAKRKSFEKLRLFLIMEILGV